MDTFAIILSLFFAVVFVVDAVVNYKYRKKKRYIVSTVLVVIWLCMAIYKIVR